MSMTLKPTELTKAIEGILTEYREELGAKLDETEEKIAKRTVDKLKATSPKLSGAYSKDWKWKKDGNIARQGFQSVIIYNAKHYQLTHLLEFGHAKKIGGRDTGTRVSAYPHIANAQAEAETEMLKYLMEELKK